MQEICQRPRRQVRASTSRLTVSIFLYTNVSIAQIIRQYILTKAKTPDCSFPAEGPLQLFVLQNDQITGRMCENLVAHLCHHEIILDSYAAYFRKIDSRFYGQYHARLEDGRTSR